MRYLLQYDSFSQITMIVSGVSLFDGSLIFVFVMIDTLQKILWKLAFQYVLIISQIV